MAIGTVVAAGPARALRRPRRLDVRALVGVLVTLVAFAGSLAYWTGSTSARTVVIATRDLSVGATLAPSDLAVAQAHLDDPVYNAAVPGESLDSLLGRELTEPVHAQQLLARAQVSGRSLLAADQMALTVPARPDTAAGGRMQPGDAVRVLATTVDKTAGEAHTRVVLERATVFDVGREQSSTSLGSAGAAAERSSRGAIATVTLAVTADQARELAEARRGGELDIALLPAQRSSTDQ